MIVHHAVDADPLTLPIAIRLKPGCSTAPRACRLPLLPSGPDGVHRAPPRRTRLSTSDRPAVVGRPGLEYGIRPRCSGLRVQGTASSPLSTITISLLHCSETCPPLLLVSRGSPRKRRLTQFPTVPGAPPTPDRSFPAADRSFPADPQSTLR